MKSNSEVPIYDSAEQKSPAIEELREIYRYKDLVTQMVRRDILTRYKRSVLGVAWTMLNPLGTTIILAFVFSNIFGTMQENYVVYVLSGLIAWTFFDQTTKASITNLIWGGSLLKRIYVPRTVFAVSSIGTGLVNLILSFVPLLLVMLFTHAPIHWTALLMPIPILFLAMFSLGVGLFISSIAIFYADVAEMYQIVLTAWFYLSPVIFVDSIFPPQYLTIIKLNPMYYLINLFRAPIYEGRVPTAQEFLLSGGIATITLLVGWVVFTRKADQFSYRV